jgi:hypothetical protein
VYDQELSQSSPTQQSASTELPPSSLVGRGGLLFKDRTGEWWRVCEWTTIGPADATERALVFESENVVRRVQTFPDRWRELTHEALEALMAPTPAD